MKFEEVLPLMREGRKARNARMKYGEYWICAQASFSETVQSWPTLAKVYDNPFETEVLADVSTSAWGIERWAIMDETWEIVDDI